MGAQQAEEIARLTDELASLQRSYEVERHCSGERMAKILELKRDVERVTAERDRLSWRPVSVKPTKEDADLRGYVEGFFGDQKLTHVGIDSWPWTNPNLTYWRPFCPPPAHTPEEAERERFEKWWNSSENFSASKPVAWHVWQAARAAKEVQV